MFGLHLCSLGFHRWRIKEQFHVFGKTYTGKECERCKWRRCFFPEGKHETVSANLLSDWRFGRVHGIYVRLNEHKSETLYWYNTTDTPEPNPVPSPAKRKRRIPDYLKVVK